MSAFLHGFLHSNKRCVSGGTGGPGPTWYIQPAGASQKKPPSGPGDPFGSAWTAWSWGSLNRSSARLSLSMCARCVIGVTMSHRSRSSEAGAIQYIWSETTNESGTWPLKHLKDISFPIENGDILSTVVSHRVLRLLSLGCPLSHVLKSKPCQVSVCISREAETQHSWWIMATNKRARYMDSIWIRAGIILPVISWNRGIPGMKLMKKLLAAGSHHRFRGFESGSSQNQAGWYPLVNQHNYGKIHHFSWENSLFLWPCSIAILT